MGGGLNATCRRNGAQDIYLTGTVVPNPSDVLQGIDANLTAH